MQVVRFGDAARYEPEPDWRRLSLCNQASISIEHFTKPADHASPRHAHPQAQILLVLEGKLSVTDGEGRVQVLEKGSPNAVGFSERPMEKSRSAALHLIRRAVRTYTDINPDARNYCRHAARGIWCSPSS